MMAPELPPEMIGQISALVAEYITAQRARFLPKAAPLTAAQRTTMDGFFSRQLLDAVTLLVPSGVRVESPPFYSMLMSMGFSSLPDFTRMAAITFCDVVVSREPFTDGLLFHELVHAEQYRQLGIQRFAELYLQGFLTGGRYEAIPLEVNAYALEGRFRQSPDQMFSVEHEVSAWIRDNRF
jgi:hypothetical protein